MKIIKHKNSLKSVFATGIALLAPSAMAAQLDFTISTSGFTVENYATIIGDTGTLPGGTISGGSIVKEAGFESLLLDVNGQNLDIVLTDPGSGNPYFDGDWYHSTNGPGGPGGLGSCRSVNAIGAQCETGSDDNLTLNTGEQLRFDFQNDNGDTVLATFGDFTFRDDDHNLINGSVQVSYEGGLSALIAVTNGIGNLSGLGQSSFLLFNDKDGATSNYYISGGNFSAVPIPAAAWLFGSGLIGLAGIARRKNCLNA